MNKESEPNAVLDLMIVDDSAEDVTAVRRQLRAGLGLNCTIREYGSAEDALLECLKAPPDCLLLDVRMPELDGLGFLEKLAQDSGVNFPVIMFTNYGEEGLGSQALRLGAQDFLIKNQTTPELLRRSIDHARERFRISRELALSNARLSQANRELQESLGKLEAIFSQSGVGIAQIDSVGRFIRANDAYCALAARSEAEIQTLTITDICAGDDCGRGPETEKRYRRPDGSEIWVDETVSLVRNQAGKPLSRVILARDISARKAAQSAQATLASIVQATGDAVTYQDRDGIIRAWNRGAELTYGYLAQEAIGKPFAMLVPADKAKELAQMRRQADAWRPVQGLDTVRIRRDGYRLPVAITFSAVRNDAGEVIGYSSIARDITERKRAQEQVQKSEARYRSLANSMPHIVFTNDSSGDTEFMNQQWARYTGRAQDDAFRLDWISSVHPDDRQATLAAWRESVGTGSFCQLEYRLRKADGAYRWHLARAVPCRNPEGNITGWIGTATDIHDRKMAELNLQLSEERLRLAQTAARIVVWDLDLQEDRYADLPAFFEQFEFEQGTHVRFNDWLNRIHPGDQDRIRRITTNPSNASDGFEIEFRVIRNDHSVVWLLGKGSVIFDEYGQPARVTGVNVDITARKKVEAELSAGRERLRLALEASGTGIWEWDIPSDQVSWSDEVARLFGVATQPLNLTSGDFEAKIHPADRLSVMSQLRATLESDAAYAAVFRVIWPDGSVHWLEGRGAVMRGDVGQPLRMIGAVQDVTERRRLEERVMSAEKLESIGAMAGGLAHDFNNLLTGVIGCASLAQGTVSEDHPACPLLLEIIKAGERAASLTSQLLAYSGKSQPRAVPVDVSETARAAAARILGTLGAGIRLEMDLQPNLVVAGDEEQIRQLVTNLLQNAAESIQHSNGRIGLCVRSEALDENALEEVLRSTDSKPGDFVKIEIHDNGYGIDDSIKDKIFDPFFTTKFAGRGLGLAAVAGIVKAHAGAIRWVSAAASGTHFTIYLPALPVRAPAAAVQKPDKIAEDLILIVDDEELIGRLAKKVLNSRGYRAQAVTSGEDALRLMESGAPISLVLLDLTMPGMSGQETLRRIRQLRASLPVVLSSGYTEQHARTALKEDDFNGFLPKPYTAEMLVTLVSRLAGKPQRLKSQALIH